MENISRSWIPPWGTLRTIGNSSIGRLTVLIPLVGYFIIFNDNLVKYVNLASEFVGAHPQEPGLVPTRLLQVYFALCFVAAGAAIYAIFCPPTIKQYELPTSYVASERSHLSDFEFERIEETLRNSEFDDRYRRMRNRYEQQNITMHLAVPITDAQKEQVNIGVLHLHYALLNLSYPLWRAAAAVTYVIGFILLAIPSIQIFVRVAIILFRLI